MENLENGEVSEEIENEDVSSSVVDLGVETSSDNENDESEISEVNENITEIKQILLENKEVSNSSNENESVQIIPTVTEEEFIKLNNSFCTSVISLIFVLGVVGGLILGKAFQGIFK